MIVIRGTENTPEFAAAQQLRNLIVDAWPDVESDPEADIRIVAAARCHGQVTKDIDILLTGSFATPRRFRPLYPIQLANASQTTPDSVEVRNLCLTLEVKGHGPDSVQFQGTDVFVSYGQELKNATQQSDGQVYGLINYLRNHTSITPPVVIGLIWLIRFPMTELPPHITTYLASSTWDLFRPGCSTR